MNRPLAVLSHAALFPRPGELHADISALAACVDSRQLRRTSHFCRLGLLAAHRCLAAAPPAAPGLILCTGYGPITTTLEFTDSIMQFGAHLASPTAFSTSVHNIAASTISLHFGLTGPIQTISQGESSFAAGLSTALDWLVSGRAPHVLLGALDEYSDPLDTLMRSLSYTDRRFPAEGALFLLLGLAAPQHGMLRDWSMGWGIPPEPSQDHVCLTEESLSGCELPEHANGNAPHPAGPVRALAASLLMPGGAATLCRSIAPNGWWSQVHHEQR